MELTEALQRGMIPPSALPAVPGLQAAARYTSARSGLDIGGDWYDGFVLPDGALAFAIGDVQGHDVEAAAFMGQIRIAMRATAATATDPGEVVGRTNDLLLSVDSGLIATCTYLRLDPVTRELHSARAGHVAAIWATADGRCGFTSDEGGLPLGIEPGGWSGDAMGVLVVTPLLLVMLRVRMPRITDRWIEASALLVVSVAVSLLVEAGAHWR